MSVPLRSIWNRTWVCASRRLVLHLDTGIPYQTAYLWLIQHGTRYNARVRELPKAPVVIKPVLHLVPNSFRGGAHGVLRFDYNDIVEKGGNSFDVSYTVGTLVGSSDGSSENGSSDGSSENSFSEEHRLYLTRNPLPGTSLPPVEFRPMMMRFEFLP